MERLEPGEVRRIARLARLDLSEEEVVRLRREMAAVLGHFAELAESGMPGAIGMQERGLAPRSRADVRSSDSLLHGPDRLAPEWRDGFFLVPRLAALEAPAPARESDGIDREGDGGAGKVGGVGEAGGAEGGRSA